MTLKNPFSEKANVKSGLSMSPTETRGPPESNDVLTARMREGKPNKYSRQRDCPVFEGSVQI